MLTDQLFPIVVGIRENRPPSDRASDARIEDDLRQGLERTGVGDAATASNNPPLYYLVAGGRLQGDLGGPTCSTDSPPCASCRR